MEKKGLPRELALRIGLAATAMEQIDLPRFTAILNELIGLPITRPKLKALTAQQLAEALKAASLDFSADELAQAVQYLHGDAQTTPAFATPQPYQDGEFERSIRVAVASNGDEQLDGHFASCTAFLVYQLSADAMRLIDVRLTAEAVASDDKTGALAELIGDCHVLFVISVGGPAAARVIRQGIHPIKQQQSCKATDALAELQTVLAGSPPPWLAKIIGVPAEQRARIQQQEEEPA